MTTRTYYGIAARSRDVALCIASANTMTAEMKKLLADGANPCAPVDRTTALHEVGRLGLLKSAQLLIAAAGDLNVRNSNGSTPLMNACLSGQIKGSKVAMMLIEAGADVKFVRKSDGMTALKFAVRRGTPQLIQRLIDAGASVDGPKNTDQTALILAARADNVENLKVLLANGANPSRRCKPPWAKGKTAAEVAEMEKCRKAAKFLRSL